MRVVEWGVRYCAHSSLAKIIAIFWIENWRLGFEPLLCLLASLGQVPSYLFPQHLVCHVVHSMPFSKAGEKNQTFIFSMNKLMTHLSLESWICQSLKIEKWRGNLKESGEVIADGRWQNITIIIISVIGEGNKPYAEALPLAQAPGIISSQSHTGMLTPPGDSLRPSSWVSSVYQGPCR